MGSKMCDLNSKLVIVILQLKEMFWMENWQFL